MLGKNDITADFVDYAGCCVELEKYENQTTNDGQIDTTKQQNQNNTMLMLLSGLH